jgi:hypothetical protein
MRIIRRLLAYTALEISLTLVLAATSANAAAPGYLYVSDFDSIPSTHASANLPINAQTVQVGEHSLFEMSMSNQFGDTGNIIEIGVTTDVLLNHDTNPHWFVFSWINGTPQGYNANSHFVSIVGNFWSNRLNTLEGTSQNVAFTYYSGDWWLSINGASMGYFPGSEWSGAFTMSLTTQVFGEVYYNGTFYPTLDGTVSGYESSGGGHLSNSHVDSPYRLSNASRTGFTVSGPVPEPSTFALAALGAFALLAINRRRRK